MATYNGRDARVTVNASATEAIVTEIGNWTVDMGTDEIDTSAFGDGWGKSDVGMKKWSGSLTGFVDPKDTTGQAVVEAAFQSGALLQDIRFYLAYSTTSGEDLIYLAPDTVADSNAGLRVTAYKYSQDKAGVGTLSVTFSGSGPVKVTTSTVA